jgi:acetyl esterase
VRPVRWFAGAVALILVLVGLAFGLRVAINHAANPVASTERAHVGKHDEPVQGKRPIIDLDATNPHIYDMPHGNHVDAYWRKGRRNVPWVVFIHGGFWSYGYAYTAGTRAWGQHERARGFAAFSIDYRLVPHVQWPTPLDDVKYAIAWIRAHAQTFGLDLNRGFVFGHSAGGLLASVTALQTGDFRGAIDLSGAVDPLSEYESAPDTHLRTAALALMGDQLPVDDPRRWEQARAVHYIGQHTFAFLVMQSRHDRTVPFASNSQFAAALRAHDYPVTLLAIPGTDHELTTAHDTALEDQWMDNILQGTTG